MATTEKVLRSGDRNYVIHVTSNGVANATATEVVDLSDVFPAAEKVAVEKVDSNVWGFAAVNLFWDFTSDEAICTLGRGDQHVDWRCVGGNSPSTTPAIGGGTGDIMLTTTATGNDAPEESGYDITIYCKKS